MIYMEIGNQRVGIMSENQKCSGEGSAVTRPAKPTDEEGLQAEQESAVAMDSDVPQPSDIDEKENGKAQR
jgi:hypothetical protein